jgi:hypothetical protein
VKRYAERIGLDSRTFGGHLLRAGFLTSAAAKGASAFKTCDISRHRRMNTLQGYVRDAIGPSFQIAGQAIRKRLMSAMGHSRRFWPIRATSAIHPIATE